MSRYRTLGKQTLTGAKTVGSKQKLWGWQFDVSGEAKALSVFDFDVQLPSKLGQGIEAKNPIVTINILDHASKQLDIPAHLKYDCQAYAMGTVDPNTGLGFIPRLACLYNILDDDEIATTINVPTTIGKPLLIRGDQCGPICPKDVLIFWKKLASKPADEDTGPSSEFLTVWQGVHASIIIDVQTDDKSTLSGRTRLMTKNGAAKPEEMSLRDLMTTYKDDTTHLGVYRMKEDAQIMSKRDWSGIEYDED